MKQRTKRTQHGITLNEDILAEMLRESSRLERSMSWLVEQAWTRAAERIRKIPAPPDAEQKKEDR